MLGAWNFHFLGQLGLIRNWALVANPGPYPRARLHFLSRRRHIGLAA